MDEKEVLLAFYRQNMEQGLHHQQQRGTVTNIVLILSGAFIALVIFDGVVCGADWVAGAFLIAVGLIGGAWSWKQHERYAFYRQRARGFRDALASVLPLDVIAINRAADAVSKRRHPLFYRMKVYYFWGLFYLFVIILGGIVAYQALQTTCDFQEEDAPSETTLVFSQQ